MTKLLAAIVIALAGAATVAEWPAHRSAVDSVDATVPTTVVAHAPFARTVTVDGAMRAVTSAPVVTPADAFGDLKLAWIASDGTVVHRGDVVARLDPAELTRAVRDAETEVASATAALASQRITAADELAGRAAAVTDTTQDVDDQRRFRPSDPALYARNTIAQADLDLEVATARQAHAELAAKLGHGLSRSGIELAELDRQRAQLALDHARTAVTHLDVRAPSDGIFLVHRERDGEPLKPGQQVWGGQDVGEIPDVSAMEAELFVLEADGDGLEVGQRVALAVVSHPEVPLHGRVKLVDKLAKPRIPGVPVQYFSVVVSLDRTGDAMKPGARVRGDIAISAASAIAVPRQAVVERDGRPFVYRRDPHGFAAVPVELGPATAGRVVVASGLDDGDVIALRAPADNHVEAK